MLLRGNFAIRGFSILYGLVNVELGGVCMKDLDYKELYSEYGVGDFGNFGIKILVASDRLSNFSHEEIKSAARKAADLISEEVLARVVADDPNSTVKADKERAELLSLFDNVVFVEQIPNEYCHSWCCRHFPWFIVTTKVGRIKIGRRKRVIEIDWSQTVGTKSSDELFSLETVTKGQRYIHAWSLGDARRYIGMIVSTASYGMWR